MGTTEGASKIQDIVEAALVECEPEQVDLSVDASAMPPPPTPTQTAQHATIEQTGADPPPSEER